MTMSDPVAPARAELAENYAGSDEGFCSDYEGIRRLAAALVVDAISDEQAKVVLRTPVNGHLKVPGSGQVKVPTRRRSMVEW
jgi:hypothetical protein